MAKLIAEIPDETYNRIKNKSNRTGVPIASIIKILIDQYFED